MRQDAKERQERQEEKRGDEKTFCVSLASWRSFASWRANEAAGTQTPASVDEFATGRDGDETVRAPTEELMSSRLQRSFRLVRVPALILIACLAAGGDGQPTSDPSAPSVDPEQGVRLSLARAEVDGVEVASVRYQVEVEFKGAREHTLALFVWVDAEGGRGRWVRRAYYNSHFQGSRVVATPTLPTGRKLLLVAYFKDGELPEDAGQWKQATAGDSHVSKVTEGKPHPDISATFGDGKKAFVRAKLRPVAEKE
jgi:hypothetical protein